MQTVKELPIEGNMYFVHTISTRDKDTCKYNPFMDGNLNVTLNRLYANRENFIKAKISIPSDPALIDKLTIIEYKAFINLIFGDQVEVGYLNFYGINVEESRKNLFGRNQKALDNNIREEILSFYKKAPTANLNIVCDFPTILAPDILNIATVRYNYNWNKVTDTDTSFLGSLFEREVEISRKFETYLYSDVQYDYWHNYVEENEITSKYFRSINIFNEEFIKKISDIEIKLLEHTFNLDFVTSKPELLQFLNAFKGSRTINKDQPILFYSSRIEDPRYDFNRICEICKTHNYLLIFTNPTNVPKEIYNSILPKHYYDLTHSPLKRSIYFFILSKLSKKDMIIRYEDDMHMSLIEQTILTDASIIHNFDQKIINSYIK